MKEYRKPTLALIMFDAKDVLSGSAAAFEIGWLKPLDDNHTIVVN